MLEAYYHQNISSTIHIGKTLSVNIKNKVYCTRYAIHQNVENIMLAYDVQQILFPDMHFPDMHFPDMHRAAFDAVWCTSTTNDVVKETSLITNYIEVNVIRKGFRAHSSIVFVPTASNASTRTT